MLLVEPRECHRFPDLPNIMALMCGGADLKVTPAREKERRRSIFGLIFKHALHSEFVGSHIVPGSHREVFEANMIILMSLDPFISMIRHGDFAIN
jgi:hypothetical protein